MEERGVGEVKGGTEGGCGRIEVKRRGRGRERGKEREVEGESGRGEGERLRERGGGRGEGERGGERERGRRAEISAEQQSEFPSSVVYRPYVTKDKMGGWL